jgi:hypothetical protein
MPLALANRNRLAVCALMLMLAPYGISLPTFARAARAEEWTRVSRANDDVVSIWAKRFEDYPRTVDDRSTEPAYGALYTGGTVALYATLWTDRPSDPRATKPYLTRRPDRPDTARD